MRKLLTVFVLLSMLLVYGCQKQDNDAWRFKREYEVLNSQKNEDGKSYSTIAIPEDNTVRYVSAEEVIEGFGNGTHVIYMGWPSCGWCRRMLPVLLETVKEYPGISIYYYSIEEARSSYETDPSSQMADVYRRITDEISRDDYDLTTEISYFADGRMRLPSSLVFFIKEGEIIGVHKRTVESHVDAYEPLNESQQKELADIYRTFLQEMIRKDAPGCSDCD